MSQHLAPGQIPAPRSPYRWAADNAPRLAPGLSTTTVLIAARCWNANGGEHSVGGAVLMTALSLGAAAAGTVSARYPHGDALITAVCYAASGSLAVSAVAGYSDGLALPVLLWLLATCAVYALAARYWREDRRTATAHANSYELRHLERSHDLQIAKEKARAKTEVAREATAYIGALAEAVAQRRQLSETAGVPELDVDVLLKAGLPGGLPEVPATPASLIDGTYPTSH